MLLHGLRGLLDGSIELLAYLKTLMILVRLPESCHEACMVYAAPFHAEVLSFHILSFALLSFCSPVWTC